MLGFGEQETLQCKAVQDIFFTRPLPSTAEIIVDFLNTQKQTQRVKQNGDAEKCAK